MTVNNENRLLCYEPCLHKMGFGTWTVNCFTVITAAVYIKVICIIATLHYWRNLETCLV